MTAQRPRDRLRRLQLAAYEPTREEGTATDTADGARHRAQAAKRGRWRTTWAIRPAMLARLALVIVLLGALLVAGLILTGVLGSPQAGPEEPDGVPTLPVPGTSAPAAAGDGGQSPTAGEVTSAEAAVYVHVAGAVTSPGLVQLASGERVADAITAAGGPADGADLSRVNLAAPVSDGEQVYVPAEGETPPALPEVGTGSGEAGADSSTAVVHVNTAGADELETLPGIGPARAADIIAYREREGPFRRVEDLLGVPGIGPATLDRLRDRVQL